MEGDEKRNWKLLDINYKDEETKERNWVLRMAYTVFGVIGRMLLV